MAFVSTAILNRRARAGLAAIGGPQAMAFLPILALAAYWTGGEAWLLATAVGFPAILATLALAARRAAPTGGRDTVTGLPLRRHLVAALDAGLSAHRRDGGDPLACLVIEIDNFEGLAAQFGDAGREAMLRTAAGRLGAALREGDRLALVGPGRFAAALAKTPRVDLETLIQFAGRLQEALGEPVTLDGARLHVTACAGFVLPSRAPEDSGEAYLAAAESALDAAQRAGPGSIRAFTRGMRPRVEMPDTLTRDLIAALDDGQIRPWFQPQLSTDTGAVSGVEALARWVHPDKGLIAPGAFLPAIARAGLFDRLGEVMLTGALLALRDWDRAGLHVPSVAVNVSAEELQDPRLYDRIRWELDRLDLSAQRLTIEILETVVARSEDDTTTRNIAALARLGCRIDLDDFGTGHASISNIRRFDVTRIKIDRSFVTHVDTDRDQQNMVAAILSMSERLGLDTLAEGVETAGEHAMLAQLGCGHVQGYSIARPMPAEDMPGWLASLEGARAAPPDLPRQTG